MAPDDAAPSAPSLAAGKVDSRPQAAAPAWVCPACRGAVSEDARGAACGPCGRAFPRVGPVLDFRLPVAGYDTAPDTELAKALWTEHGAGSAEAFIRAVFAARGWDDERVAYRTRQIVQGADRLRDEVRGWLHPHITPRGAAPPFLDLGCGGGQLLAAAAAEGISGIGIDLSLVWLLAAHLLIREHGGTPRLAAALAEHLPLADGALDTVISLDVIEHVPDVPAYLGSVDRVLAPGGRFAFSTPNRFSLSPEPHVGLWGVGWLPASLRRPYVKWRIGDPYRSVWLRSAREWRALLHAHTRFSFSLQAPPIPAQEMAHFSPAKQAAARVYNRLIALPAGQQVFRRVGAFFRITGVKQARGPW